MKAIEMVIGNAVARVIILVVDRCRSRSRWWARAKGGLLNTRCIIPLLVLVLAMGLLPIGSGTGIGIGTLQAQTFSEWFKQKKTQKKYLLAQIAGLETYAKALEKGYQMAKSGLGTIANLKQSNFLQHQLHFSTLEVVGPAVKNNPKVAAIAAMEDRSAAIRRKLLTGKDIDFLLGIKEKESLVQFDHGASAEAAKDLATLELLVTDSELQMTTAERTQHIGELYKEVRKKYGMILIVTRRTAGLMQSRRRQARETDLLKEMYGGR